MVEAVLAGSKKAKLWDRERTLCLTMSIAWLCSEFFGSGRLWLPEGTRNLAQAAGI